MAVKNNLKTIRTNKNLSQEYVARKAGLSLMGYLKIEKGICIPNLDTAYRISIAVKEKLNKVFIYKPSKTK